jgi:hypothetical protein
MPRRVKPERAMQKDLKEANAEVFYKAFHSINAASRRCLALRILRDEDLLEDLFDHFLILQAEKEKRRRILWEEYLEKRRCRNI